MKMCNRIFFLKGQYVSMDASENENISLRFQPYRNRSLCERIIILKRTHSSSVHFTETFCFLYRSLRVNTEDDRSRNKRDYEVGQSIPVCSVCQPPGGDPGSTLPL